MDIERLNQIGSTLDTRLKKKKDDEKSRRTDQSRPVFQSIMSRVSGEQDAVGGARGIGPLPELDGSETIEGLLDEVHQAGEALKRDPVFGPLNSYKKAVRLFLRYVIDHSLETDEVMGVRNPKTLQQKKYVLTRVVDERLESLAVHVLKGQADQLEILRRIDEIHGMLVDLTG